MENKKHEKDYRGNLLSYPDIPWSFGTIPSGRRIAVDTETTGLNPYKGDMAFLFSFANEEGEVTVVPREEEYEDMLREFFEDESITKIFHHMKFDVKMIRAAGFEVKGPLACTLVMSKLVNENEPSHRLKNLCAKYHGYGAIEDDQIDKWKKDHPQWSSYDEIPYPILLPYAAVDAWNCMLLFHTFKGSLRDQKDMYQMDMRITKYLIEVEDRGVLIDKKHGKVLLKELRTENTLREKKLKEDSGVKLDPNNKRLLGYAIWNAGGVVLNRTDKGEPCLDKKTLPKYCDTIGWMQDFIDFKKVNKEIKDIQDQILGNIDHTNCLHTNFNVSQARTRRFSSSSPNLQNINKKSRIREMFIPRPGHHLFYFDYSQVEYRLYAHLSGAKDLIAGYQNGTTNMHTSTAMKLNKCTQEEVTDEMYEKAKTVNFLILYGGGITGLSELLKISRGEAQEMLQVFKARTPSLERLQDDLLKEWADNNNTIKDLFGAHYHLKPGDENKLVNTLIQGTACNVLKYAMLNCQRLVQNTNTHMIQNIHDELIFEIPEGDYGIVPLIKDEMERQPLVNGMPLTVDIEWSKTNWGEKTTYPKEMVAKWTMK